MLPLVTAPAHKVEHSSTQLSLVQAIKPLASCSNTVFPEAAVDSSESTDTETSEREELLNMLEEASLDLNTQLNSPPNPSSLVFMSEEKRQRLINMSSTPNLVAHFQKQASKERGVNPTTSFDFSEITFTMTGEGQPSVVADDRATRFPLTKAQSVAVRPACDNAAVAPPRMPIRPPPSPGAPLVLPSCAATVASTVASTVATGETTRSKRKKVIKVRLLSPNSGGAPKKLNREEMKNAFLQWMNANKGTDTGNLEGPLCQFLQETKKASCRGRSTASKQKRGSRDVDSKSSTVPMIPERDFAPSAPRRSSSPARSALNELEDLLDTLDSPPSSPVLDRSPLKLSTSDPLPLSKFSMIPTLVPLSPPTAKFSQEPLLTEALKKLGISDAQVEGLEAAGFTIVPKG